MLTLKYNDIHVLDNYQTDDIYREIYDRMPMDDIISLSSSSKTQNARFFRLMQIDFLVKQYLNQERHHPFFSILPMMNLFHQNDTRDIVINHPETRIERFQAWGQHGEAYLKRDHGIDSFFDRKRIADGESILEVKQSRTDRLAQIYDSIKRSGLYHWDVIYLEYRLKEKPIQDCVIHDIISIEDVRELSEIQIKLITGLYSENHIAKYQLTKSQVASLIQNQCNPFSHEVIQLAHASQLLTIEQIISLNKDDLKAIDSKRPFDFLYSKKEDKYPFLVTVNKYNLTNQQAFKLIRKSNEEGNTLFCFEEVAKAVTQKSLTLDQAIDLSWIQASTLKGNDGRKLWKLVNDYNLSNQQLSAILHYPHPKSLITKLKSLLSEGVTPIEHALNICLYDRKDWNYHSIINEIRQRLDLSTEQAAFVLRQPIEYLFFFYNDAQWVLEKGILTKNQFDELKTKEQYELFRYGKFKKAVDEYNLTNEQALYLIRRGYNPLNDEKIRDAMANQGLTVDEAIQR